MAVTINTEPTPYSSRAIFDVETSIAEDATHVNTRVELQLWDLSGVVCKKTLPKILTTFDFTEVLRGFINFTQPTPFTDPVTEDTVLWTKSPTKTGSNLITAWANKSGNEFTNFAATGNEITTCNGDSTSVAMIVESNDISFVTGKIYVLVWKSATISGVKPYIYIDSDSASHLVAGSNYISTEIPTAGGGVFYFLNKGTATNKLAISLPLGEGAGSFTGIFELYEFEAHDWFKQYMIYYVEKYEDASGVTQSVATVTNNKLYTFFKSVITETLFNSDYIIKATSDKFLSADGYFGNLQRSQEIILTPLTGNKSSILLTAIIDPSLTEYYVRLRNIQTGATTLSNDDDYNKYSPIMVTRIRHCNIVGTGGYGPVLYTQVFLMTRDLVAFSETFYINPNNNKYPYNKEVTWLNELGGFSTFFFGNEYTKTRKAQKNTYKTGALIPKVYNSAPIMEITAETRFLSNQEAEFLDDIITSPLVMEHETEYKEIEVQDESLQVHNGDQLNAVTITYQYAD